MPLKLTMLWNFNNQGWSETWYSAGSSLPATVTDPTVANFVATRDAMTASFVNLVGWRITDLSNPRATLVYRNPTGTGGNVDPDYPTNAWLLEVKPASGRGTRQVWLRGIPDSWIQWASSGRFAPVGQFTTKYNAMKNAILAGPWGMRVVAPLKTTTNVAYFDTVSLGALGNSTKLAYSAGVIDKLQPLLVSGFRKPLSVLNGTYQPGAGYIWGASFLTLLNKSVSNIAIASYSGGAAGRNPTYSYVLGAQVNIGGAGERRVGRAFFVPRGRRSRR